MTSRQILRIAVALAAIGYVAYAYLGRAAAPQAALASPIPVHAKEFTLGALHFKECELPQRKSGATTHAFCAPFAVPENRTAADARKLDLRLALIKSDADVADRDIVVYLAGGPGQSAIDSWPQLAGALAALRRHHHILLLDQRGTGGSNALTCVADETKNAAPDDSLDAERIRQRTRECLAAVAKKADARFYTTTDAVADLEAVRQALGAPPLDLVGVSYGTRMAQQYAMRHPDGVRSIVLDSVAPNELVLGEEFASNLDDALKAQFALCIQNAACQQAFGDPYAALITLRNELRAHPQSYDLRDPITFQAQHKPIDDRVLAGLVRLFAYTPETAALLPLSIAQGAQHNFAPLLGQAAVLSGDLSELAENGMQLSVICSEDAALLTPRPQDADTMLGTSMIDSLQHACEIWPHGEMPADFHAPFKSDKPLLVLEGQFDPVTPPRYGEQVIKGQSNARLLVAKGQGHNVIGRGCLPKLVEEFVDKLEPKALDAKCIDALGPMPAFIDFNGAAP